MSIFSAITTSSIAEENASDIAKALSVLQEVKNGNFEARLLSIESTGELGELLHTINDVIDRSDAYIRDVHGLPEACQ